MAIDLANANIRLEDADNNLRAAHIKMESLCDRQLTYETL
jgi:hypothetical protein